MCRSLRGTASRNTPSSRLRNIVAWSPRLKTQPILLTRIVQRRQVPLFFGHISHLAAKDRLSQIFSKRLGKYGKAFSIDHVTQTLIERHKALSCCEPLTPQDGGGQL